MDQLSIADLKAILDICRELGEVDMLWLGRAESVEKLLEEKIELIFNQI
ncbi:MAG: hypothetical protein ABFS35_23780 [Bacteroidota bacterium]